MQLQIDIYLAIQYFERSDTDFTEFPPALFTTQRNTT